MMQPNPNPSSNHSNTSVATHGSIQATLFYFPKYYKFFFEESLIQTLYSFSIYVFTEGYK